jgi:predicted ribonuclease YlaK
MPRISEFYGIIIEMYWSDHNPPHFHAKYAEHKAEIEIRTLNVLRGRLPNKATSLVNEWANLHREELLTQWQRARNHEPLEKIQPLE